jgi:antitoxin PrlF
MSDNPEKRMKASGVVREQADSENCCRPPGAAATCCRVQALVSIDERGQMILPKEIRDKAGIRAGDKLAVTSLEKDGKMCCIILSRADDLSGMMVTVLGPVMRDMV